MTTTTTAKRKVMEVLDTSERRADAIISLMHQEKDDNVIADALGKDVRIITKIRSWLLVLDASEKETVSDNPKENTSDNLDKQALEKTISKHLRKLCVPTNNLGYRYLIFAILKCIEDPAFLEQITKRLYPTVAKNFNTTASRAERAMRHAIENSWCRCLNENVKEFVGYEDFIRSDKLTNSEFIATLVDIIKYGA